MYPLALASLGGKCQATLAINWPAYSVPRSPCPNDRLDNGLACPDCLIDCFDKCDGARRLVSGGVVVYYYSNTVVFVSEGERA